MTKEVKAVEKELTVAATTEVPTIIEDMNEWGDVSVTSKDMVIDKALLMQGTSGLVSDGEAKVGDVMLGGVKVADYEKKFKLLPFLCKKEYVVSVKKDGQWKFDHTEEIKGEFTRAYEENKFGNDYKNEAQYSFYCLTEDGGMPIVISFKGKSIRTGKGLFTQMYVQNKVQRPPRIPAHNWILVGAKKEKNDKGPYAVWTLALDSISTGEQRNDCITWIRSINTNGVKVQEDLSDDSGKNFATDESAIF